MNIIYTTINNKQGDEIFTDGFVTWNISKLSAYLEDTETYLYKLNKNQYESLITDCQRVDESKIDIVDFTKPIIIIHRYKKGHLLIDGIHRVRKAQKYNQEYILAYVLPFKEHIKFLESRADFNFIIEQYNNVDLDY